MASPRRQSPQQPQPQPQQASPPFLRLPTELHLCIITHLSFPETAFLRATCRLFTRLIPAPRAHHTDLLAAEPGAWATRRNRLACATCARLRPARFFSDVEKQGALGSALRACVSCQGYWEGFNANGWWDRRGPVNNHVTRTTAVRVLGKPDWKGNGLCKWCHNVFGRWGRYDPTRAACSECFLREDPRCREAAEVGRVRRDMWKCCGKDAGEVFEWELLEQIKEEDLWRYYEQGCTCDECENGIDIPKWMEGHRGVQVMKVER